MEEKDKFNEKLPFSTEKQMAILGHLMTNEAFFKAYGGLIKPEWFVQERLNKIYKVFLLAHKAYNGMPSIKAFLGFNYFKSIDQKERSVLNALVNSCITEMEHFNMEVLKVDFTEWLHSVILLKGMQKAADKYNKQDIKGCYHILNDTIKEVTNAQFETQEVKFSDFDEFTKKTKLDLQEALTTGLPVLDKAILKDAISTSDSGGGLQRGDTTVIMAPVNMGKCEAKNTKIIDYSGRVVLIQDIKVGDKLMGPDGKPRTVLSTTKGYGPMYKITPKNGGDPFVCNDKHILSLKRGWDQKNKNGPYINKYGKNRKINKWTVGNKGEIINLSVEEFLSKSKTFREPMKLWRVSLDFTEKSLPIDPYILGVWLGDGNSSCSALTTMDEEIKESWIKWVEENEDQIHVWNKLPKNKAVTYAAILKNGYVKTRKLFKENNLLNNKHIPHEYKTSSREQRLELLAGLIDTDGYYNDRVFEIIQKNDVLAEDICFLARSLGFKVKSSKTLKSDQNGTYGEYNRITIVGQISKIPTKLLRKKAKDSKKNPLESGFEIEYIGEDEYYGFSLDGDSLYLHHDFTVTHNSTALITMMCANIKRGKSVLYMTHEGRPEDLKIKILANMLDCTIKELFDLNLTEEGRLRIKSVTDMLETYLKYIPYNKAGMTIEEVVPVIRNAQEVWAARHQGNGFDLLVSDYPAILTTEIAKRGNLQRRNQDQIIYNNYVQLALEYNFHSLLAIQTNREGSKINRRTSGDENLINIENVQESFGPIQEASNVLIINRSMFAQSKDLITFNIGKSRGNETGIAVIAKSNYSHCKTHDLRYGGIAYRGTKVADKHWDMLTTQFLNDRVPDDICRQLGL